MKHRIKIEIKKACPEMLINTAFLARPMKRSKCLAKARVAGSNPVSRFFYLSRILFFQQTDLVLGKSRSVLPDLSIG